MGDNMTCITEFTLLGFPLDATIQMLLFGLFSLFYVFTLLGNGVILGLISLDSRLHCTSSSHTWPSLTQPMPATPCPRCWETS
uniref:G-protein coupled receptors family 1 profile domain-containing protein n=1 Tax=Monodon monoceros TaxID=40151 RepID=A0A8C6F8A2_MONMO